MVVKQARKQNKNRAEGCDESSLEASIGWRSGLVWLRGETGGEGVNDASTDSVTCGLLLMDGEADGFVAKGGGEDNDMGVVVIVIGTHNGRALILDGNHEGMMIESMDLKGGQGTLLQHHEGIIVLTPPYHYSVCNGLSSTATCLWR